MATIEIPDDLSDITAALAKLRAQLAAVDAQREALLGAIALVQKRCKHPNMYRGTDIGGGPDGYCPTCGYSY